MNASSCPIAITAANAAQYGPSDDFVEAFAKLTLCAGFNQDEANALLGYMYRPNAALTQIRIQLAVLAYYFEKCQDNTNMLPTLASLIDIILLIIDALIGLLGQLALLIADTLCSVLNKYPLAKPAVVKSITDQLSSKSDVATAELNKQLCSLLNTTNVPEEICNKIALLNIILNATPTIIVYHFCVCIYDLCLIIQFKLIIINFYDLFLFFIFLGIRWAGFAFWCSGYRPYCNWHYFRHRWMNKHA